METVTQTISQVVRDLYDSDVAVAVTRPDIQFGDAATNVALQLAGKTSKNPREIAEEIAARLRENQDYEEVSVAGPGFINIRLSPPALLALIHAEPKPAYAGENIVFEYSCPNAFKELHTGHLYQTIFGDIAARLMLVGGAKLTRTSFGGDVGLHVAKALYGMRAELGGEYPEKLDTIDHDAFARSAWISQCYVRGAKLYEEDAASKAEIDELNTTIYGFHDTDDHESPLTDLLDDAPVEL